MLEEIGARHPYESEFSDSLYGQAVGSIMYFIICTIPDLLHFCWSTVAVQGKPHKDLCTPALSALSATRGMHAVRIISSGQNANDLSPAGY